MAKEFKMSQARYDELKQELDYSKTTRADEVAELIKAGKIKEIADMRDETDLGGLKLTIDLKRGVDPEKLMQKLFRLTPLQDSFPCNFNILIAGMPRVMGVGEILDEWTAWRTDCVKRRIFFQIQKCISKLTDFIVISVNVTATHARKRCRLFLESSL